MNRPQMLSSVEGRISEILIVLPGIPNEMSVDEYEKIVEVFDKKGTVFRFQLDVPEVLLDREGAVRSADDNYTTTEKAVYRGATYRYVSDIKSKFDWKKLVRAWQDELKALQSGKDHLYYERWAQDPFVTLSWNGATILLKSTFNLRMCDFTLPFEIATQGGDLFFVKPTELYLEGGNLLRGLDAVFVGSDTVTSNQESLNLSRKEVIEKMAYTLGVDDIIEIGNPFTKPDRQPDEPIYRGGGGVLAEPVYRDGGGLRDGGVLHDGSGSASEQPIFHIDVFMNAGGRSIHDGRELIFMANTQHSDKLLQPAPLQRVQYLRAKLPPDPFAKVRDDLKQRGFQVVDLPIFFREEVWYSWNNCLVEVDGDHRKVYLPSYILSDPKEDREMLNSTFEILEKEVEAIYSRYGFGVVWIEDGKFFRKIAKWGGSLHCVTKVLRRDSQ